MEKRIELERRARKASQVRISHFMLLKFIDNVAGAKESECKLKNAQNLFPICDYTNHFSFVSRCVRFLPEYV